MNRNNPTIHLSWQLLFIPPLMADCQLVCGAAWDVAPSSVQAPQYWSSRVPDGPDPITNTFSLFRKWLRLPLSFNNYNISDFYTILKLAKL